MRHSFIFLVALNSSGCKLFGALEEARDLLEEPVTMQGLVYGVEPIVGLPAGVGTSGTILDVGARALAWVQRTGTSGVQVVDGAKVSLLVDGRPQGVKLVQDGAGWFADGRDGLAYVVGKEVKLIADYGGERGSISMELPAGPVVNIPSEHTPQIGMNVIINPPAGEPDFDNGFVVLDDLLGCQDQDGEDPQDPVVYESPYDVEEPIDPDNLELTIPGEYFEPDCLYAVGAIGLVASIEDDLLGLNPLGSGMLVGQMVVTLVSTGDFTGL